MTPPGQGAGQDIFREVLRQQAHIRAVLGRAGVPEAHLDDLVQDVLVVAHRRIAEGGFRRPEDKPLSGAVAAWLTGIARNVAKDFRRAQVLHHGLFVREEIADLDVRIVPSPEARLLAKEELRVIARLKLTAAQREIITRTGMGHTAIAIGASLGIVPDTVATQLRRVRAVLRTALKKRQR